MTLLLAPPKKTAPPKKRPAWKKAPAKKRVDVPPQPGLEPAPSAPAPPTLKQVLADLPTGADEVARVFREAGVTGTHSSSACPGANYLRAVMRLRPDDVVSVTSVLISVTHQHRLRYRFGFPHYEVEVETAFAPRGLAGFVQQFDRGNYPDLFSGPGWCYPLW